MYSNFSTKYPFYMLYNLSYQKVPILSNNDHIALIQKYIEIEHKHYRYNPEN
ncbi:hypothetical protein AC239_16300 [Bacteroides fragilis]|nr:hypothetical protein AC239_16300 [Bacteroides fragilis]